MGPERRAPLLKPSRLVPVSSKLTEYENSVLEAMAHACGLTKSSIIRAALAKLLEEAMKNDREEIKKRLAPGYDIMFALLKEEALESYRKCISRMRGDGAEQAR
ncbi:MAG: hypothetical protein ABDH61_01650 [Acidilobaceae archaeon]